MGESKVVRGVRILLACNYCGERGKVPGGKYKAEGEIMRCPVCNGTKTTPATATIEELRALLDADREPKTAEQREVALAFKIAEYLGWFEAIADALELPTRASHADIASRAVMVNTELKALKDKAPACVLGVFCAKHDYIHGAEAEDLRSGIDDVMNMIEGYGVEPVESLRNLLENCDARDSVAYLEVQDEADT